MHVENELTLVSLNYNENILANGKMKRLDYGANDIIQASVSFSSC